MTPEELHELVVKLIGRHDAGLISPDAVVAALRTEIAPDPFALVAPLDVLDPKELMRVEFAAFAKGTGLSIGRMRYLAGMALEHRLGELAKPWPPEAWVEAARDIYRGHQEEPSPRPPKRGGYRTGDWVFIDRALRDRPLVRLVTHVTKKSVVCGNSKGAAPVSPRRARASRSTRYSMDETRLATAADIVWRWGHVDAPRIFRKGRVRG